MSVPILEPSEFRLMQGTQLNLRKKFSGRVRGERMSQRKGVSIEFADYREYSEGDDLRHLDWNVLARLGQPVTKTYQDEEDLVVYLLIDTSSSMDFGNPTKWFTAQKTAAALAFASLSAGDAVAVRPLGTKVAPLGIVRGRTGYVKVSKWLESMLPSGDRSLDSDMKLFANTAERLGLVVIISDFLDLSVVNSIRSIAAKGHEVWMIQILSDLEISPDLEGDLRLIDAENDNKAEITINSITLGEYQSNLSNHNQGLANEALRSGGRYALIEAGTSLAEIVKGVWRRERWIT